MNVKIFGGLVAGSILGAGITYSICRNKAKTTEENHQATIDSMSKDIEGDLALINDLKKEIENLNKKTEIVDNTPIYTDDDMDDDADNDIDVLKISPKRILINSIDGKGTKIFSADPDDGFEVIDGSDIENGSYTIVAQNIPSLNNFLLNSIKTQLQSHYVSKIDSDTFDEVMEDMIITVSLSFIDEETCIITEASAVVPFELFGETNKKGEFKIYSVEDGELDADITNSYFGSSSISGSEKIRDERHTEGGISTEDKTEEEETPIQNVEDDYLTDENLNLIADSISYSKESLKSFFAKLQILMKANPEAGKSIYDAFIDDVLIQIHKCIKNDILDDDMKNKISANLRAIIANMKKNYGSDIKWYNSKNN